MIKKSLIKEFLKYCVVGGIAFIFDFASFYICITYLGINYLLAGVISFIIGLNVNYYLAKYFVFKESKIEDQKKEYLSVAVISLSGLAIKVFILWLCVSIIGLYVIWAKLISVAIVLFYNFAARKIFVFK